jgi:hypothetical protein
MRIGVSRFLAAAGGRERRDYGSAAAKRGTPDAPAGVSAGPVIAHRRTRRRSGDATAPRPPRFRDPRDTRGRDGRSRR